MEEFPYTWSFEAKPTGMKGKPCQILPTKRRDKAQGLVMIRFKDHGIDYLVRRKGLVKRNESA